MEKIVLLVDKDHQKKIFGEKYYDRMRRIGEVKIYDADSYDDKEYVKSFVSGATIIVTTWGSPVIDKDILDACPELRAVIHAAGSIKPVISDEFVARRIRITNSAVAIGEGVAETALGFAISACKGFYQLNRDTSRGIWRENAYDTVIDFYDINVGVISGGYVGRHMVKLLKNFHVNIYMYDPILTKEQIAEIGAEKVELCELLSICDVVSIHAPSIPATDNMINKGNLCLMKDKAILINTARGSVINEKDLIEELKKGRLFACIDVTDPEPPVEDNALRSLDNVILTPHIAGTVSNGLKRIALHACEEIERLVGGEKMRTEVDLDSLSRLA